MRLVTIALGSLLFLAPEVEAQIPQILRRMPRTGLAGAETKPALGVLGGPTSRAADVDSEGSEAALFGELPLDKGWRVRGELGAAAWDRLTLTRGTAGLYRVHGRSELHSFIGVGIGLYRHRMSNAADSSLKGGAHVGVGAEYEGRGLGFNTEVRVGAAPNRDATFGGTLHASILFGVKKVFRRD